MGAGSGAAGFGAGFAKGLAGQLHENMLLQREDERRAQEKRDQTNLAMFPHIFEASGGDLNAMEPWLQTAFPDTFGAPGKKAKAPKAGESSPLDMVGRVFNHFRTRLPGQTPVAMDGPGTGGLDGSGSINNPTAVMDTGVGRTLPSGTATEALSPILAAAPAAAGQSGAGPSMLPAPQASAVIPGTGIPTTVQPPPGDAAAAGTGAGARKTFMGVPLLTPEEKADRAALPDAAKIQAKVKLARQLYANGTAKSMEEAMDYVGLYNMHAAAGGAPNQSIPGTIDGKRAFGVFNKLDGKYHDAVTGDVLTNFLPAIGGGARNPMGTIGTQAAVALGYDSVQDAIDAGKHKEITAKIEELLKAQSKQRAAGTAEGQFEAPITVKDAAATGAVVGSNSKDYTGQIVGTEADIKQRRMLEGLKTDIARVVQPQPRVDPAGVQGKLTSNSLLDILPSATSLKGQLPGATVFARRNSNFASGLVDENGKPLTNKEAMARLDSNISSMINVLAIARGQRGTQTEKDADRAYQSLVALQGNLFKPTVGDTRESALARITEAQRIIDEMIGATPGRPVPNAAGGVGGAGGPAPAAGGPAPANPKAPYKDASGRWIIP